MTKHSSRARAESSYTVNIPPYEPVPVENQKIFPVTQDRARYVASIYIGRLRHVSHWSTPAGILLTIVTIFITADFKDALGVSRYTWQAAMLIAGILAFCWLIQSIIQSVRNRGLTADRFVEDLKGNVSQDNSNRGESI